MHVEAVAVGGGGRHVAAALWSLLFPAGFLLTVFRTQAGPVSHPARCQLVRAPITQCSTAGALSCPRTAWTLPRMARLPLLPRRGAETPWTPRAEVMG